MRLTREKLAQAARLVAVSELDAWLVFVRETVEGGDPVLPLLIEGGLTWQSALIVARSGKKVAIVGNYDADPLKASGDWDEVDGYVRSIREPLAAALERFIPEAGRPRIGVNYSVDDVKADGLSHGMYLLLEDYLRGTRFEGSLVSAQPVVTALRSIKTDEEVRRIRAAIEETGALFELAGREARVGMSELELYELVQREIDLRGLGYGWDRTGDPIVNSGPDSMTGHGVPSASIRIAPGHVLHMDLGVVKDGYSSDIQRCWYVPAPGESQPPADVERALAAVTGAISAGAEALRPGAQGWEVDRAAREFIKSQGYPEYMHALGHQVGRVAHDGGAILGPQWERYGATPRMAVEAGHVYTLELGVYLEDRGYLGIEEMVQVTDDGVRWLTTRQTAMPMLR
jgi:Xaa-Pro aminopeptidase